MTFEFYHALLFVLMAGVVSVVGVATYLIETNAGQKLMQHDLEMRENLE